MTIAQGIYKKVAFAKETVFGQKALANAATLARRVSMSLQLSKKAIDSNEIRDDHQKVSFQYGPRIAEGDWNNEWSPGTYAEVQGSVLRRDFTAGPTVTGAVAVLANNVLSGPGFAALGFKPGHVVRAAGLAAAGDNARNLVVLAVAANTLTVFPLVGPALTVAASAVDITVALVGKHTFVPDAGHTNDSYTFEDWYSDIEDSEVFKGTRIGDMSIKVPAAGMAEVAFKLMAQDMESAEVRYFVTPAIASTTNALASSRGVYFVDGVAEDSLTEFSLDVKADLSTVDVAFRSTTPDIFRGILDVSGQMSILFKDGVVRDKFLAGQSVSIIAVLPLTDEPDSDFVAFRIPVAYLGGATKADGAKGIVQTVPFSARKLAGDTTIGLQDSTL